MGWLIEPWWKIGWLGSEWEAIIFFVKAMNVVGDDVTCEWDEKFTWALSRTAVGETEQQLEKGLAGLPGLAQPAGLAVLAGLAGPASLQPRQKTSPTFVFNWNDIISMIISIIIRD